MLTGPWWQRRGTRRAAAWTAAVVLLCTFVGFYVVPLIIRYILVPQVESRLNGRVMLRRAAFNPYSLDVRLDTLEVQDSAGVRVVAFERFDGNFQVLATLFSSGYHFRRAVLTRPYVHAALMRSGEFNLAVLRKPVPASTKKSKPLKKIPRLVVDELGVEDTTISVRDETRSEPFAKVLTGLDFRLDGLDTRPEVQNIHRLTATTDVGERLEWEGSFFVDPLSSQGRVVVTDIDLPGFMPYAMGFTKGRLTSGKLAAELSYDFAPVKRPRRAAVVVHSASITDAAVEHEGEVVLRWQEARVTGVRTDADTRSLAVDRVVVTGARLRAKRDAEGINLMRLPILREVGAEAGVAGVRGLEVGEPSAPEPESIEFPIERLIVGIERLIQQALGPWSLSLGEFELADAGAEFSDLVTALPVQIGVSGVGLRAGPVRSEEGFVAPFDLTLRFQEEGTLHAAGRILTPSKWLEVRAEGAGLQLAALAGYLPAQLSEKLPPVRLAGAVVSFDGELKAGAEVAGEYRMDWSGRAAVEALRLDRVAGGEGSPLSPLAVLERLSISGDLKAAASDAGDALATWKGTTELTGLGLEGPFAGPVDLGLGSAGVEGTLAVALKREGAPGADFTGSVRAGELRLVAPEVFDANVAVASAVVAGIDFSEAEKRFAAGEVIIDTPDAKLVMKLVPTEVAKGAEGQGEGSTQERAADGGNGAPIQPIVPKLPYAIKIGLLQVSDGTVVVRDSDASPPAVVTADEIGLSLSNFGSDGQTVGAVDFSSRLQGSGRVKLVGSVDAFRPMPYADVKLSLTGMPLKPYDPFTGWYIGYLVESGRMSMTLPIRVEEGKLKGSLEFNFDRFYLGQSVKSPAAPDVPIKLGLSLLRDPGEQISGNLSLSGDMMDPSFSISGIVFKAFFNLLIKAATAPFQVLGALFGAGDGVDLSRVEFEPGTAELTADSATAMDVLTRAMTQRPALKLTATGRYVAAVDEPALRRVLLREQMLERVQRVKTWIVALTDELYRDAVSTEFRARYGNGAVVGENGEPLTFEQLEDALLDAVQVPRERVEDLVRRRVALVTTRIVTDGGVAPERVVESAAAAGAKVVKAPSVEFDLE